MKIDEAFLKKEIASMERTQAMLRTQVAQAEGALTVLRQMLKIASDGPEESPTESA